MIKSQKQAKNIATSHRNLEVTSVNQWHYRNLSVSCKLIEPGLNMPEQLDGMSLLAEHPGTTSLS